MVPCLNEFTISFITFSFFYRAEVSLIFFIPKVRSFGKEISNHFMITLSNHIL